MDKIQLLPDSVANQIAAGEVIQRPASVIKELVENSVDAGAKKIDILVTDAGRTSIQVIDDGIGMSTTDARLAFERHATSKIRKAEDLFSLHTMGFRGEALPSIAAVAQVTLKTRRADDNVGTSLTISASRVTSQEPISCPAGSNFLIENLFFNVPVRRRFLKSNHTELQNIVTAFQRIALVYPEVAFTLRSNGMELYNLRKANMHQRIVDVFGKKLDQNLLPVNVETTVGKIEGFVGKPESARKKGTQQYFFVNGRYMKHNYFMKAVMQAYERLLPQGEQVPFFIYFTVPAEDIDVNIHPTKTEIKFQDEATTWQILNAAVREAIGKFNDIPSIDFDTEGKPDIPVFDGTEDIFTPQIDFNPQYNPFNTGSANKEKAPKNWETLYEGLERESSIGSLGGGLGNDIASDFNSGYGSSEPIQTSLFNDSALNDFADSIDSSGNAKTQAGTTAPVSASSASAVSIEGGGTYMQYKGAYIITSVSQGLMVTDQSRAHERILYEQYMKQMGESPMASQKVLFPETVQFSIDQMVCLPQILPEMATLGFELTNLGGGTYAINGVPASLEGGNMPTLIEDMVASACEKTTTMREELFSALAVSMARNTAIPHGQYLSAEEMESLMTDLLKCENTAYTPNGQKIYSIVAHQEIVRGLV